jgi:hypothetical protein
VKDIKLIAAFHQRERNSDRIHRRFAATNSELDRTRACIREQSLLRVGTAGAELFLLLLNKLLLSAARK